MTTAVDCLAGPSCLSRGGLDRQFDYFQTKMNEQERLNITAPDGSLVLMGCSFTNYIAPSYLSNLIGGNWVNVGSYGMGLRHVIQQLYRGTSPTTWDPAPLSIGSTGMKNLLHRAGAVVLYGLFANSIGQEMAAAYGNHTEAQMYGNIDYFLQRSGVISPFDGSNAGGGLGDSFTGKGVFVAGTPVTDPYYPDPNLTNARIKRCNDFLHAYFGAKPGWAVVDVNEILAPGWSAGTGQLQLQYAEPNADGSLCHLNRTGIDVVFNAVKVALSSLGVP